MNGPSPSQLNMAEGYAEGFEAGVAYARNRAAVARRGTVAGLNIAVREWGASLLEAKDKDLLANGLTIIRESVSVHDIEITAPYKQQADQQVTITGTWTYGSQGTLTSMVTVQYKLLQALIRRVLNEGKTL